MVVGRRNLPSLVPFFSKLTFSCSSFLNDAITDVLHLNRFKVRRYRGNRLENFVKQFPKAEVLLHSSSAGLQVDKFKLPDRRLLEGVKTKEKSLLKMLQVGFQYQTSAVQQLYDGSLQVSLSSRVAVLGSGEYTLTGEMEPIKGGKLWKHPNLVIDCSACTSTTILRKLLFTLSAECEKKILSASSESPLNVGSILNDANASSKLTRQARIAVLDAIPFSPCTGSPYPRYLPYNAVHSDL